MKTIKVVAAIIIHDGKIFATQRGYGEFKDGWEFPGGKIEPGETPQQALFREIKEELEAEIQVEIGKGSVVREGKDVTIVATGICVDSALGAAEKLAVEGIQAEVVSICTIKPLDEDIIVNSARKTGKVVTVEEHSVIGGLGSAVCDCLCAKLPTPVKKLGMQDVFGESGSAAALVAKYGLDAEGVYKSVKEFV